MSAASPHTIQSNCRRGKLITPSISVVIRPKWSRRDDIDDLQWSVSANYGQLTKGVQISYMPITRNSSHLGSLIRDESGGGCDAGYGRITGNIIKLS